MRLTTSAVLLAAAALLSVPAMADQSGGTMSSGSIGMGSDHAPGNATAAPNMRWGGGTSATNRGTSGSDLSRATPKPSDNTAQAQNGSVQNQSRRSGQ
jgi:hypothetical protein